MVYSTLSLANYGGAFDSIPWSDERTQLLNWVCGILAFLGLMIQFLMERGRTRRERDEAGGDSWTAFFRLGWLSKSAKKAA